MEQLKLSVGMKTTTHPWWTCTNCISGDTVEVPTDLYQQAFDHSPELGNDPANPPASTEGLELCECSVCGAVGNPIDCEDYERSNPMTIE